MDKLNDIQIIMPRYNGKKEMERFSNECLNKIEEMNMPSKVQGYMMPSPHGWIISKFKSLYPKATDERIRRIAKVIFNGPATIIIDIDGNKTVVQYQHDRGGYDRLVGWFTCLIKYLFNDSKKYHDIIEFAFVGMSEYETDVALEAAIISQIGYKDFKECLSLPNLYKED